ncbi:hypothetical protein L5515_009059 [Caenorhabditis briggsae]|nr:hypothetical protein L5515_009059 [Caenorhabditis briggsae]
MYRVAGLVALLALYIQAIEFEEGENINVPSTLYIKVGANATIGLPVSANYRREIRTCTTTCNYEEQLYRVCNGKNKKTCGYWESVKTKKKVASGKTTYNKNKKSLIIRNMKVSDFGKYMTGNKKKSRYVEQLVSFGK